MSDKRYGEYEQVNGGVVNDAYDRIAELEAKLALQDLEIEACRYDHIHDVKRIAELEAELAKRPSMEQVRELVSEFTEKVSGLFVDSHHNGTYAEDIGKMDKLITDFEAKFEHKSVLDEEADIYRCRHCKKAWTWDELTVYQDGDRYCPDCSRCVAKVPKQPQPDQLAVGDKVTLGVGEVYDVREIPQTNYKQAFVIFENHTMWIATDKLTRKD